MRKNIVFSTTKQWNPGDEFILKGIINILRDAGVEFNPIIFNRNPDIRSYYGQRYYRQNFEDDKETTKYIRSNMLDNSAKPWMSYEYVDAIIFAGTPEWQGWRNYELYLKAIEYKVPVFFWGIDNDYYPGVPAIDCVLKKSKNVLVRNEDIIDSFHKNGILAKYMTCPSIFAASYEKIIDDVRCIGLIYRGNDKQVACYNGWNDEKYYNQIKIYKKVISEFSDKKRIVIICHYIDEVPLAIRDFTDELEVLYSCNSEEYLDIYKECDLVIGSRIHGMGLSTSLCIPSIPMGYDSRRGTFKGFYPYEYEECFEDNVINLVKKHITSIKEINLKLIKNKERKKQEYLSEIERSLDFQKLEYEYNYIELSHERSTILNVLKEADRDVSNQLQLTAIKEVLSIVNSIIKGKKILIKGAGKHTSRLINYIDSSTNIVAIIDNLVECDFMGHKVIKNEDICCEDFDYILISSAIYENEMIEELNALGYEDRILAPYRILGDNYFLPIKKTIFDI